MRHMATAVIPISLLRAEHSISSRESMNHPVRSTENSGKEKVLVSANAAYLMRCSKILSGQSCTCRHVYMHAEY